MGLFFPLSAWILLAGAQAAPPPVAQPTPNELQRSFELIRESKDLMAQNHDRQAIKILGQAIHLDPASAEAWNDRAIAEIRTLRYADAVYDSSFALGLAPGNPVALDTRAWAFNKLKKYREALSDSGFVLSKNPSDAFGYENRAFALAGLQDFNGSLSALSQAASLDPRFKNIYADALKAGPRGLLPLFMDPNLGASENVLSGWWRKKTFLSLFVLSMIGGILVALGVLHILFYRSEVLKEPSSKLIRAGDFWSRYEKIARVGEGGMGVVYEARDRFLERKVAVKKLRDQIKGDSEERKRFITEARLVARLRHENIVEIYSIVEEGMDLYLVFEFVKGKTIERVLKETGRLDFTAASRIFHSVCRAVDYAHRQGVVHRDIKPSNIMIGEGNAVKVMDFGVAGQAKSTLVKTQTDVLAGTPVYMAPEADGEQIRRESDIFSLGICFFEMLSGRLPFEGEGNAFLVHKVQGKHLKISSLGIPGLPPTLDDIFDKALEPDPEKRYHGVGELWAQIVALAPRV